MAAESNQIPQWAQKRIEACRKTGGTVLDLSRFEYDEEGNLIGRLNHLTPLDALPEALQELEHLKKLNLGNNQLSALPDWLQNLSQLSYLDLRGNKITPLDNMHPAQLTFLDLNDLHHETNLDRLLYLTQLSSLYLSDNNLTALPDWFQNLTQLASLDLSNTKLTTLPSGFQNLTQLTSLDLRDNQLTALPEGFGDLTQLTSLDLRTNQLTALPSGFQNLTQLISLDLRDNKLTALPEGFGDLTQLTSLDLRDNQLTALPEGFGDLTQLASLDLSNTKLTTLPSGFQNLTQLTSLDLRANQLTALPEGFGGLTQLTSLDLRDNKLTALPEGFGDLTQLTSLDLRDNQLTALPEGFGDLTQLTSLDLRDNKLTALPEGFGDLTQLTSLDLRANQLTALPEGFGGLTQLTSLDLRDNKLTALPEGFQNLTQLTSLDLRDNKLTALPEGFEDLTQLTSLDLRANQLTALPSGFQNLTQLISLDLSFNQLTALPERFGGLTQLASLDLRNNQLTALPEGFGYLTQLAHLDLNFNQLAALPEGFGDLTQLTSLDLRANKLTALPEGFGDLTQLVSLDLSSNQLTALPEGFGDLTQLASLYLSSNQLTALPEGFGDLTQLVSLDLSFNQLTALPEGFGDLTQLTSLYLRNNPKLQIPNEILRNWFDPASILAYYFETLLANRPLNEAKLILVGQGNVGKTSLVNRLIHNSFDPIQSSTPGIQVTDWQVKANGDPIDLHIWDFGGQEIMHATHQFFLTRRSLYLLVLNVREDEIKNRIDYWLKTIESFGGDSPIIVVGNHDDYKQGLDIDKASLREKYPQIMDILTTSCENGTGISELREMITTTIDQMAHVRDAIPPTWFQVKERLENKKKTIEEGGEGLTLIPYPDFVHLCEEEKLTNPDSQRGLIGLLHHLGIVLNFRDEASPLSLQETQVLNPAWVTNGVYKLINDPDLIHKGGIFQVEDVRRVLSAPDYPDDIHRKYILDIMEKFELCYSWDKPTHYLVPSLLGKERVETNLDFSDALRFEYHYDVLPSSLFAHLMVRCSEEVQPPFYWRSGVLLGKGDTRALVTTDRAENILRLAVIGSPVERKDYLAFLRHEIETINQRFTLEVKQFVPVPGHPEVLADYNHLKVLAEKGVENYIPVGLAEEVSVKEMLGEYRTNSKAQTNRIIDAINENEKKRSAYAAPPMPQIDRELHEKVDEIKKGIEENSKQEAVPTTTSSPLKGWFWIILTLLAAIVTIIASLSYFPLSNWGTGAVVLITLIMAVVILSILGRFNKEAADVLGKIPGGLGEWLTGSKSDQT